MTLEDLKGFIEEFWLGLLITGAIILFALQPSDPGVESTPFGSTFDGQACVSDCSGHQSGYDYAQEHNITDTNYDNGNSNSFNEGVRDYATRH